MKKWLLPALTLALIGTSAPASATILFAGGEDTSGFTVIGSNSGMNSPGGYLSAHARVAAWMSNSTSTSDPPANRIQTPTFTSTSNLWVHGQVASWVANTGTNNEEAVIIRSPDGVARILVLQTGTAGTLKVSTRNAAGTITDLATSTATFSSTTTNPTAFDLYINYTCSSAGGVQLYIGGTLGINYSGNPCTDSATSLDQVDFASVNNETGTSAGNCGGGNGGTCWSEIIIADGNTLGDVLQTLAPQAAGNTQSWTPNTVGDINPTSINNSNFIATGSSNSLSQWTIPTLATGQFNVLAVVQEAEISVGTTGPQHFEWLLRTKDGTNNVTGSLGPTTVGAFQTFSNQIWATNPTTGVGWVPSDIATGFNLGIESLN
jgi:hypothetical protein